MARTHEAREHRRSRGRNVLVWLAELGVSFGLYLCFAAKVSPGEAMLGVAVAALAATASRVVLHTRVTRFAGHRRWIAQAWRLPKYAVTGTWEIFWVLARHLFTRRSAASLLLEVPIVADEDEDDAAARLALLTAYTTITPNFIVLGFDEARRRMIFHQIERSEIPEMTRRLGARP